MADTLQHQTCRWNRPASGHCFWPLASSADSSPRKGRINPWLATDPKRFLGYLSTYKQAVTQGTSEPVSHGLPGACHSERAARRPAACIKKKAAEIPPPQCLLEETRSNEAVDLSEAHRQPEQRRSRGIDCAPSSQTASEQSRAGLAGPRQDCRGGVGCPIEDSKDV